jgi:lipid-binding SYLF domain-containing protein
MPPGDGWLSMEAGMFHQRFAFMIAALAILAAAPTARAADRDDEVRRLENARTAFQEIRDAKDETIPQKLMEQARCIAVFPGVVKAALGIGARHGKGVMSCRDASGHWGPPVFLELSGGSYGFQVGVEKADVVLFFMTDKSVQAVLDSKFTLGAKAGVAAGPVGRTAEADTDIKLDSEIYSYSRSKGLFAGVSLEGAKIAPDKSDNRRFYGKTTDPRAILVEHRAPGTMPAEVEAWVKGLP